MKKVLVSMLALTALAGCAGYYDYYKSGVRYTQDGDNCVYYAGEYGRNYSRDVEKLDNDKKIVYRNTRCSDLYNSDIAGQAPRRDRNAVVPAAKPKCACAQKVACSARRYVIVPA